VSIPSSKFSTQNFLNHFHPNDLCAVKRLVLADPSSRCIADRPGSGGLRVVVLDSLIETNHTPGLLGKAQRGWFATFLQQPSNLPTLLFVHHTLDDGDGSLLDAPRLFDILKPHRKVKGILYGHSHRYAYEMWDGVHLINLRAVGYNFNDDQPVGWVDAKLSAAGGSFTLHAIGGKLEKDGKTVAVAWRA
jgi:hypothetical protein